MLLAGCGVAGVAMSLLPGAAPAEEPLPAKAYIEGVPFISYHEVRGEKYPDSEYLNPSVTAVVMAMYRYWGEDFLESTRSHAIKGGRLPGWSGSSKEGATLADLRALVAQGLPAFVAPATTPDAHRLYVVPKTCAFLMKKVAYAEPKLTSGALGEMVILAAVDQLRAGGCELGLNDSVYVAARLVIGYDDERAVLVVHDPSLGPNLELGYAEFERMWKATEAEYWAVHPQVLPATPPGRVDGVRGRTADDEAAVALFRAYGLDVGGRYAEAEPLLREALALEGLSAGRRHLLGLELAVVLSETGRCAEAIEAARAANAAFDGYALGHNVLATLLECSGQRAAVKEAKQERTRAKQLCDVQSQRRVADELGRDFHVVGCKNEMLGWYRP